MWEKTPYEDWKTGGQMIGRLGGQLSQWQRHLEHLTSGLGAGDGRRNCMEDKRKVKGRSRSASASVELEKAVEAEMVVKRCKHWEES